MSDYVHSLIILSSKDDWYYKALAAADPKTSSDILIELAKDESMQVKTLVAMNPNTPKEALFLLSMTGNDYILKIIARRKQINA